MKIRSQGIPKRRFSRSFTISDDIIVKSDLKDGMLNIDLERVIPEEKKLRLDSYWFLIMRETFHNVYWR